MSVCIENNLCNFLQDGLFPADYVALRDSLKVQQMLYDARTLNVYAQVGICWIRPGFLKKKIFYKMVLRKFKKEYEYIFKNLFTLTQF